MTEIAEVQATTQVITANAAAAWGAYLARPRVVAAYPITPQTSIIETLADLTSKAPGRCEFITVESEHSALSACCGASYTGSRVFTATSAQGLLLMHEITHWAAGGRLPIVMVILDAFVLSHTAEAVEIPDQALVDEFLPPREPVFRLDVQKPAAFGGLLPPTCYQELRQKLHDDLLSAISVWERFTDEWAEKVGRKHHLVEPYRCDDAELILITSGTPSVTAQIVIDEYRSKGEKIGLLGMRLFRPTPFAQVSQILSGVPKVAILDRDCSYGHHGIWLQELKSSLYRMRAKKRPNIYGYIAGLGGRDITVQAIRTIVEQTKNRKSPEPETVWVKA
jgi:pyruvate/2-oxoacid:ferredoxin oxidoreductase alpha subunit